MPETTANAPAEATSSSNLGQTIVRNAAWVTAGTMALKVINFLFSIYVVRRLGDHGVGQYAIVIGFVGVFSIFAELGMSEYVMREIARDRRRTGALFWNLVVLRLILAVIGIAGITTGAAIVGYPTVLVAGIFIQTCGFLLSAFEEPLDVVLEAHERLDYSTASAILGRVVTLIVGVVLLVSGLGFLSLIVAGLVSLLFQIGLATRVIRRYRLGDLSFQIDPRLWLPLIRSGIPFGIISLALTISFGIDTVILSMFQPEKVVGWYDVPYGLVMALNAFLFGGLNAAIVPSLSRAHVEAPEEVERWYHRSVKLMALLSLPISVGTMLVAFPLIRFLYTDAFRPAAVALQVLIWDFPFLIFSSFCGNMTTVLGEERAAARIYSLNAVANILLNLYAIPRFGLVGAALVTVVTDLIGMLQFHFLLSRKLRLPNMLWMLLRIGAAAALMGVVVALAGQLNLFVQIGAGVAVYGGLVLALRLMDQDEWALVLRALRWRRGSRPAQAA
jgi:O-antigen/teichoic acid export membrane protein